MGFWWDKGGIIYKKNRCYGPFQKKFEKEIIELYSNLTKFPLYC